MIKHSLWAFPIPLPLLLSMVPLNAECINDGFSYYLLSSHCYSKPNCYMYKLSLKKCREQMHLLLKKIIVLEQKLKSMEMQLKNVSEY